MSEDDRLLAGRYKIGDLIGRGGMSEVHLGQDTRLGRTVAIKLLKSSLALDPAFRTRFRQEAQAAARMAHPTIVRVFDAGEETVTDALGRETQQPFIVMEYVDGRMLKDVIRGGALDPKEAVRILDGVLTALEYSHRAGVVHRDIKPGNVMITKAGQVKVMDFGIARAISDSSTTVAQTTAILGTASYFSPEQAKGELVDARTDLYSAGVVLFEMLTGRPPFRGDTPVAVAYQHVSETPSKPSSINPKVSPALDLVVEKALSKDRFTRYQTAAEFRADLDTAASGRLPIAKPSDEATTLFGPPPVTQTGTELAFKQLAEDDRMVRTQRRPPAIWIWAGILSVIVIIAAVIFWVFNLAPSDDLPSSSREVPALAGLSFEDAQTKLADEDLSATQISRTSDTVDAGLVIESDPPAGETVEPGTYVTVYVSSGKEQVKVPDVTNTSLADAQAQMEALGLTSGAVTKQASATVPADVVLTTNPVGGTMADAGSSVDFVVSSGMVTLPNLVGNTLQVATDTLQGEDLQLTPNPVGDPSCEQQPNMPIIRQSLAPGAVPQGSTIDLSYCSG